MLMYFFISIFICTLRRISPLNWDIMMREIFSPNKYCYWCIYDSYLNNQSKCQLACVVKVISAGSSRNPCMLRSTWMNALERDLLWRQSCSLLELRLAQDIPDKAASRGHSKPPWNLSKSELKIRFSLALFSLPDSLQGHSGIFCLRTMRTPCKTDVGVVSRFRLKTVSLRILE